MHRSLYYLGLACLFTHELDAVTHSEWRLLFGLRDMPDAEAASTFVWLHVPLFFLMLWLSHHTAERVRVATRAVVATFLCVHAVLHYANRGLPESEFQGPLSVLLISSAGVSGAAYLVARSLARRSASRGDVA